MASRILWFGIGVASTIIGSTLNSAYSRVTNYDMEITVEDKRENLIGGYYQRCLVYDKNGKVFQIAPAFQWCWNEHKVKIWDNLKNGQTYNVKCYGIMGCESFGIYPKIYDIKEKKPLIE